MKNSLKQLYGIGAIIILFMVSGCQREAENVTKYTGLVVINVLDKKLYDDCHIKGSISVPFEQVIEFVRKHVDKDAEIVLYCSNYMCTTSGHAAKKIAALGYNVVVYEGGTAEWYQQGLPVEGPAKEPYLKRVIPQPEGMDTDVIHQITSQELAHKLRIA